ncbi:MAG: DUF2079 domain-containing protein [Chloroflexi bacterium]|nr:MAG: hypothetical protein AUH05_07755 [Ktedonobacter sp. 13_2_20CM_53_11]TME67176.1 MAG: DUF2079 domain-containing protein [Chloroflexota bacterium]
MIKSFDARRQQQAAWWLLFIAILIYAIVMSVESMLRYDTFKATAFDLGNMDQVLWNTIHGRWFQFTNQAVDWYGPPTRLALHFEPILLLLSLLYAFGANPHLLLISQTLALASGALPVFLLTRKYIPEWPLLAPLMAAVYLISPALLGLNIFDFHPISFATPLLLYAILALTYKRYGWFILACILAASCKEDIPFSLAILGLFLIWKYKLPRLGIALTIGSLVWSSIAFGIIIPHFYPGTQHNNFWYRYEVLGSSPGEAIGNLILHPWLLFTTFITFDRLYYLASLFRSTGFLCLLAPEWLLLALPTLAENLLSTDSLTFSGVYQYNAAIIPFVMIAAIHGTRRLITCWQDWRGEHSESGAWDLQKSASMKRPALSTVVTQAKDGATTLVWRQSIALPLTSIYQHSTTTLNAWITASISFMKRILDRVQKSPASMRVSAITQARWTSLACVFSRKWQQFSERMEPLARAIPLLRLQWITLVWVIAMAALNLAVISPILGNFWADHIPGTREQNIQRLLSMIPADASISAGSNLNPHVSERQHLAVFPSLSDSNADTPDIVQYIIVDLNAVFPEDRVSTDNEINHLLLSGQYKELARTEGVVLLARNST